MRGLQNNNLYSNLLRRLDAMMREYNHWYYIYVTAKERLENDLGLNKNRIVIIPQLNLIMEKKADRCRENLPTANKITLLIFKEDSQAPGRDLILILKTNRPAADQNPYL